MTTTRSEGLSSSTALASEVVVSWWNDWRTFLNLRLELNALRARAVTTDLFDEDEDDGARREREINEALNMIPLKRREVFEAELETQRAIIRAKHEGARTQSSAEVDLHAVERAAIELLLDIAQGNPDEDRLPAVTTDEGWYDVHAAVLEQVPSAETYKIAAPRRGPSRNALTIIGVAVIWLVMGSLYWYTTRPNETAAAAPTAPEAAVNGVALTPWPVRAVLMGNHEVPVRVVEAEDWQGFDRQGVAGWKAGSVWPMELCVPRVEAEPLPSEIALLGSGAHLDRVFALTSERPQSPALRLTVCNRSETLAYGSLKITTPQPMSSVGEARELHGVGAVTVVGVSVMGPGQDTTIPHGRLQVQVSVDAPADVDWPLLTPMLVFADGSEVRLSEVGPSAVGGGTALVFGVDAAHLTVPTPVALHMSEGDSGVLHRWRMTLNPARSRLEELTASTRFAVSAAAWEGGRLQVELKVTSQGELPLAISANDITVTQDGEALVVPAFAEGARLLAPGKTITLKLELLASPAKPVELHLGASGVVISAPEQ